MKVTGAAAKNTKWKVCTKPCRTVSLIGDGSVAIPDVFVVN